MHKEQSFKKDDASVYKDKSLIRRRYYLSLESLVWLDSKASDAGVSPSLYLDALLQKVAVTNTL